MFMFKNRYGELRSGWSIVVLLLISILGLGVGSSMVPEDGGEASIALKITVTMVYSLITIGGAILLFKLIYKRRLSQMGLNTKGWIAGAFHGFVLGTVSIGLIFAILVFVGEAEVVGVDQGKIFTVTLLVEFISVSIMAFSEEVLMRGFLMTALKPTRNKWVIFLAPSILFSLFHLMNPGVTILSLLNTFLAGMLFAYMFLKSGKLWLPSGYHIAWNFFQGDIFGMNVSGNSQTAIFSTKLGTNELLTGGSYGPEGGLLVTFVLLLGFLYIRFIMKRPKDLIWTMESDLPFTQGKLLQGENS